MRLGMSLWFVALSLLIVGPALAQSPPPAQPDAQSISMFEMYFFSGDLFGIIQIWIILLMSAISIALIIQYSLKYARKNILPPDTQAELDDLLSNKKYREAIEAADRSPSFLGKLMAAALSEAANGYSAMERAIEEEGDAETTKMLRPLEYLNLLGNIGPMMGLFGTVYGMIVAFQQLVAAGGRPDPAALAAGISTALVTTFWGLVVAMPALSAYALLRNKIDALTADGILIAEDLIRPFKPGGKKAAVSPPAPSTTAPARSDRPRAAPKPE